MVNFTPQFLDEIRARINTSEVVGRKVRLQRKGKEHHGLCPFHNEKTPSFTVNDQKGFYHCFGCGAHGDIIRFLTDAEGLPFPEAVERLATQAGLEMPKISSYERAQQKKQASLADVVEMASQWFEQQLQQPTARALHQYLDRRQLSPQLVKEFRLGFAPDNFTALGDYLTSKNIPPAMMMEAGLIGKSQRGDPYDKFRHRLIFPISDQRGRVIAFGGRVLGDAQPKYLNSSDTPLFRKGEILYNLHRARPKAYENNRLVVAEGYMDVIALHRAGIEEAVAPLGTAMTESHVRLLWKCVDEPILCLDGDAAGQRAMERAAHLALPLLGPGKSLRFAVLPKGMDPDDLINTEGAGAMEKRLQQSRPLSDVLWTIEKLRQRVSTPEDKANLEQRLEQLVARIAHPSVQNHYKMFFREKVWKFTRSFSSYSNSKEEITSQLSTPDVQLEEEILAVIVAFPSMLKEDNINETVFAMEFSSKNLDKIRLFVLEEVASANAPTRDTLCQRLRQQGFQSEVNRLDMVHTRTGLASVLHTQDKARARLEYALTQLHMLHLKEECREARSQYTEESELRASAFQEEIGLIEQKLQQMELLESDEF